MEVYIKAIHLAIAVGVCAQHIVGCVLSIRITRTIARIAMFIGRGESDGRKSTLAEGDMVPTTPGSIFGRHDRNLHWHALPSALNSTDGAQFLFVLKFDIPCELLVRGIKTSR